MEKLPLDVFEIIVQVLADSINHWRWCARLGQTSHYFYESVKNISYFSGFRALFPGIQCALQVVFVYCLCSVAVGISLYILSIARVILPEIK